MNLDLEKVSKDIDWSTALSLIKYEGVYMFGGRDDNNNASNRLLCINIKKSIVTAKGVSAGEPLLTFQKLEPKGIAPPARYMHTMTYFKDRSLITIAGGRNDKLSNIVLGDLWVLRLDDLEYCKVTIASTVKM